MTRAKALWTVTLGVFLGAAAGACHRQVPLCEGDDCQCSDDADCPDGLSCDEAGECRPLAACAANAECLDDQICLHGTCTYVGSCTEDDHCPGAMTCEDNLCVGDPRGLPPSGPPWAPPIPCEVNDDCAIGEFCHEGGCHLGVECLDHTFCDPNHACFVALCWNLG